MNKKSNAPQLKIGTAIQVNAVDDNGPMTESLHAIWDRLGLILSANGPITNIDNALRIFEGEPLISKNIWFDDFHYAIFTQKNNEEPHKWTEDDTLYLTIELQRNYGLRRITEKIVERAIVAIAKHIRKHEIRDWMDTLIWDGIPRISDFFNTHLGSELNDYTKSASRNFWISMPARIYNPGCLMRTMPVLKGKQWSGKSTVFACIAGKKFYAEIVENLNSNNFFQSLHGHLLMEFADLSGFDKADLNRIKQVISCWKDHYRAPYEARPGPHLRQCILVATTNEEQFLKDETGNTRFWPIETTDIKLDLISKDREQLFAEAITAFKNKENWYIMPQQATEDIQERFRKSDAWEEIIEKWLIGRNQITIYEIAIASSCLNIPIGRIDRIIELRIGHILSLLKWRKTTQRVNGVLKKVWRSSDHPSFASKGEIPWQE